MVRSFKSSMVDLGKPSIANVAFILPVLGAFAAVGWLVGWITGASNTPVGATALLLVFGLVGAFTYAFFDTHFNKNTQAEKIDRLDVDDDVKSKLRKEFALDAHRTWLPAFYSGSVIVFCIICFWGIEFGARTRLGKPKTLDAYIDLAIVGTELSSSDTAMLQNLVWRLKLLNLTDEEVTKVFQIVIESVIVERKESKVDSKVDSIVDSLVFLGTTPFNRGRLWYALNRPAYCG